MIVPIDELVRRLDQQFPSNDTKARDALWIRFDEGKIRKTIEYSTHDVNQRVHIYLGENEQLLSLEIFS